MQKKTVLKLKWTLTMRLDSNQFYWVRKMTSRNGALLSSAGAYILGLLCILPITAQADDTQLGALIQKEYRAEDSCEYLAGNENGKCVDYFVTDKYKPIVSKLLAKEDAVLDTSVSTLFQALSFRGVHIGMSAQEVLDTALKASTACPNTKLTFYNVEDIVGEYHAGGRKGEAVSQAEINCLPNGYFDFTTLGRLDGFAFDFFSTKRASEIASIVKKRLSDNNWDIYCKTDSCDVGSFDYKTSEINWELSFDNSKAITKDGVTGYNYSVTVTSEYLSDIDDKLMRIELNSN